VQRDDHVTYYFDPTRDDLANDRPNFVAHFGSCSTSHSHAARRDLIWPDVCGCAGLPNGDSERVARLLFGKPSQITGARYSAAEHGRFIADYTGSLAGATIDSEIESHAVLLSHRG
jgi:hypothetical protein